MRTFADRFIGAARLTPAIYEEVEADKTATGQAMLVVALASVAGGIGLTGGGTGLLVGTVAALFGWVIWAVLIYVLGAKVFPQPQTPGRHRRAAPDHGLRGGPRRAARVRYRAWDRAPDPAGCVGLDARGDGDRGAAGARLHLDGPRPHGVRGGVGHHARHACPPRRISGPRRTIGAGRRGLIRASVPERVAMLLTGHKSRPIFDRYNIINEQELLEAGDQLIAYLAQHAQATPRGGRPHPARTAAPRTAPPLRLVRRTTA